MLTITGLDELIAALRAMGERVEAVTGPAVHDAQAIIAGQARANLSRYSHQRNTPTPSPPGEPPALITGRLRSSFDIAGPTETGAGAWMSVMGPTVVYARIQELGGRAGRGHRSVLPARPYLRPAIEATVNDGRVRDVFVRAWAKGITG